MMVKVIVDSGSSIKLEEKEQLGVDILPIRVQIGEQTFWDGLDLTAENLYTYLNKKTEFPKTSLPGLGEAENLATHYTSQGDDVLILTISSEISGTYQALRSMFDENPHVLIYDTRLAVGGIRFLAEEAVRHRDEPLAVIKERLDRLLPRIVVMAIPAMGLGRNLTPRACIPM